MGELEILQRMLGADKIACSLQHYWHARLTAALAAWRHLPVWTAWECQANEASAELAPVCARISRLEGMEAHARSADVRARK